MTQKQTATAEWLNSAYLTSQKIEALKEEKRRLIDHFNSLKYSYSPSPPGLKERQSRLDKISEQIDKEAQELDLKWLKVKNVIESVPQKHYALLSYRYLSMLSWQTIEDMLFISTSTRKRQHLSALDAVAQKLSLSDPLQHG